MADEAKRLLTSDTDLAPPTFRDQATFTVNQGDSWAKISRELFGDESHAELLAEFNGSSLNQAPHPEQKLMIPPEIGGINLEFEGHPQVSTTRSRNEGDAAPEAELALESVNQLPKEWREPLAFMLQKPDRDEQQFRGAVDAAHLLANMPVEWLAEPANGEIASDLVASLRNSDLEGARRAYTFMFNVANPTDTGGPDAQ